ncbi:hypothetical protein CN572_19120 [Bacillus wiedmannii]|uniref:hypothetical protein n=1 Tax=Bacillus wiedmannii TaxID=1890302 RepID=UPI000BEF8FF8|nr:hypothetical protein [Bacillus wiedmannii]PEO71126.1 hypothetical protein CN572_19120 [Bacillus wiedmannii]
MNDIIEKKAYLMDAGKKAIELYGVSKDDADKIIELVFKIEKVIPTVNKYIDKLFFSKDTEDYLIPMYAFSDTRDREGRYRGVLLNIFSDGIYMAALSSVRRGDSERFAYVVMNIGEVMKEIYIERVNNLNHFHEFTLNRFDHLDNEKF